MRRYWTQVAVWLGALFAVAVFAVAGCGGSSTKTVTVPVHQAAPAAAAPAVSSSASRCPPGFSTMGCASAPLSLALPKVPRPGAAPVGGKFPDVSSFQGHPNWDAAKPHIVGAVAKAGEFVQDPDFAFNVAAFKRLKIPYGAYWFVRNTGCAREGSAIISTLRAVGFNGQLIVLDMEVPESRGYAPCLSSQVRAAFHLPVVIYTAPGTWAGGDPAGLAVWVAAYGPSHAPCVPWTCHPLAWQYTDGVFGPATFIPGIPLGDVSVNMGLFSPAKPDPYAIFPKQRFALADGVKASENLTVRAWDRARCRNPVRRPVCKSSRYHMQLERDRDVFVAHHTPNLKRTVSPPRWRDYPGIPLGARVHGLQQRLTK